MRSGFCLVLGVVCLAAGLGATTVDPKQAPAVQHRLPSLASVFPQGARPGETVRVEIMGEYLDRASVALFTASPLKARLLTVSPTRLAAEFTIPADAKFGHHQFRVVTPRGASNPVLFRVGDQPHRAEKEPNSTFETAERVDLPVTLNARLDRDDDFDFFQFHVEAGETWIFDLRAARNGNGLDAALVLLDRDGRKIDHDEDTFIWDPFIAHKFEKAGDYVAVVQPTHRHNDPSFAYQLDIRRAPHLETLAPISFRPGSTTEATVYGRGLTDAKSTLRFDSPGFSGEFLQARGDSATVRITVPATAAEGPREMRVVSQGLSNPVTLVVDATPAAAKSGPITIPASITGVARYRQPERYKFHGEAGQKLVFEVRAMRYGSPVDSHLRLLDAAGKQMAVNDDGNVPGVMFNKDSRLAYTVKTSGEYEIEMRNLTAITGEDYPYQLVVREAQPTYELQISDDHPFLYAGETKKVKVAAERLDGFDGALPIEVAGLPAGITMKPAVIAAGAKDGEIVLEAAGDAKPGAFGELTMRSSGAAKLAWHTAGISSGGGEGRAWVKVDRSYIGVAEKPLFSLECAFTNMNLVRGGTAELKVMVRRQAGFQDKIAFRAENLPRGVTVDSFESGGDTATLRFKATADAELGRAAWVAVLGTAGGQMQEAPKISLQVD